MASETKNSRATRLPHASGMGTARGDVAFLPRREELVFPIRSIAFCRHCARMVEALVESEPVCINVCNGAHEAEARAVLDAAASGVHHVLRNPTNEPWCRDHGPIFLTRDVDPKLAIVDWDYKRLGKQVSAV